MTRPARTAPKLRKAGITLIEREPSSARSGRSRRRLPGDLVVPPPLELQDAEAVTERIGQPRHASPGALHDLPLEPCAGRTRALDGPLQIRHGEVEVNRCPVSPIVPRRLGAR